MHIASIGIDLGKSTFHLVGLRERNKILLRTKFTRSQLLAYTANLPASLIGFPTATMTKREQSAYPSLLRGEGDERTVQRLVGKPAGVKASFVTEGFIRIDTCGFVECPDKALHLEAGYIYADCFFEQLQNSCSPAADHT